MRSDVRITAIEHLQEACSLLPRLQRAFGNYAFMPFCHVLDAVTRLIVIVRRRHEVADQVITCNSVMATAWSKMDCLTDCEFVRQICLPQVGN